jgi:Zn-dependent protease/predicted transcriptional regulator
VNETLRLGHIAGIRIGVHWTVLVIFLLILTGLSTVQFPALYEDLDVVTAWAAGTVAAVAFFASLLTHELAHAIVARRNGLVVDGIVLWLFGGVAKLKGDAPNPLADLRIAGIGPLVSLGLGVGFSLLAWVLSGFGVGGIAIGMLGWLALINVVLAFFNLVPAAPLDGGRILRAILWQVRGDRTSAAISAAKAGRVFGSVLVGLGLVQVVFLPGFGGLWMMLIGWFVTAAAGAEEQQARIQDALAGLRVRDLMTPDPVTVRPGVTVASMLHDYVLCNRFSSFPVVDDHDRLVGLITLNRIRALDPRQRAATCVGDIACERDEVAVAGPDEPLLSVLPRLSACEDGRAVVVQDGRVIGILSPTDISRMLQVADLWSPDRRSSDRHGPVTGHTER